MFFSFEKESYADIEKFVVEQLKQEKPAGAAAVLRSLCCALSSSAFDHHSS
jgi:hypothetical protein